MIRYQPAWDALCASIVSLIVQRRVKAFPNVKKRKKKNADVESKILTGVGSVFLMRQVRQRWGLSLSLKKHKKEPFWIASPWCLRGNWKSSPDVFSHHHNICLISGKRRIRFLASFPSPFPLQFSFLPSSTNPPSVFSLPSSRSLQAEQVKSADLLLLIWGFDWYYCKAWLERNRCVEIRRTHRNQRAIEWKQTHLNYLFCVCVLVCAHAYKC